MNEKAEQIRAVMSDEAFVKACLEAENEETVQKLLADKGIEMSLTEIELMGEMLEAVRDGKISAEQLEQLAGAGELSEDELEAAAGGIDVSFGEYVKDIFCKWKPVELDQTYQLGRVKILEGEAPVLRSLSGTKIGAAVIGVAAVAGLGYGVYDAIRRRW